MISRNEAGFPFDIPRRLRNEGVEIACRRCETRKELTEFAADADLIWLFGANVCLDAEALEGLPRCRGLFRSGSGMDALPCDAAQKRGIRLYNTPDSISESVAEHAVALLFSAARNIPEFDRQVREGKWDSSDSQTHWHLTGRTLALIGYGRIARTVEKMVAGFSMHVIHFDPFAEGSVSLEDALRQADFVSLHCPLTPGTRHLIDASRLALMKPGALLVNTSRGAVIDEQALYEALSSGRLGGAALDVTEEEPLPADSPLRTLRNVILTPHCAAFSADFSKNFFEFSYRKILAVRDEWRRDGLLPEA